MVDSDQAVAAAVERDLKQQLAEGWSFVHVAHFASALETARQFHPTVMLLELGPDGIDHETDEGTLKLIETVRQDEKLCEVPLVLRAHDGSARARAAAIERGASDYFDRLPEPVELVARLRRHSEEYNTALKRSASVAQLQQEKDVLLDRNRTFQLANHELQTQSEERKNQLKLIGQTGVELSSIQDLDILMEHILKAARKLLGAEAGAIITREGRGMVVRYYQNDEHERAGRNAAELVGGMHIPISNNSIAGRVILTGEPINIQDVYNIKPDVGYKFLASFDERISYRTKALLTYPLRTPNGDVIGAIQLANPFMRDGQRKGRFDRSDESLIEQFAAMASVALERTQLMRTMILRMIAMAETHDPQETGAHVNRVAGYSRLLFDAWASDKGLDPRELARRRDRLSIAAMLHDIGKIGISDSILKKPSKLEPHEFAEMQLHTAIGARLFMGSHTDFDDVARVVALHHHEWWDGTGYPGLVDPSSLITNPPTTPITSGLAGEAIPLEARIVAIADVHDALASQRPYKDAWPEDRVIAEIDSLSGSQFDPALVAIFLANLDGMRGVREAWRASA